MSAIAPISLEGLPTLDTRDIRLLWINDWYDGPIEAVVEYAGAPALFVLHDPALVGTDLPWRWVVFALPPKVCEQEARWQRLFVQHVSDGWDYTGVEHPPPSGRTAAFYEPYATRTPIDVTRLRPLGWVAEMPELTARR
jgi:hypothetical protein